MAIFEHLLYAPKIGSLRPTSPHSFKISACASSLQIKTYSHMYLAYLTLSLLSQEFPPMNLCRCSRNQGPPWVGSSGGGGWKHDPGARKEPPK